MAGQEITKPELFERLAGGHAAGITVVTPNRRLAQVLTAEFDSLQCARNLPAWDDADILPYGAFVQRLYEDSVYADGAADLPRLLTPAQERRLWETVLEGAELLSVADTAADCAAAWRIAHAWRIEGAALSGPASFPGNEDTQAFAGWAREYRRRCASNGFTDAARLPDLKLAAARPQQLVAFGFDILPPQAAGFPRARGTRMQARTKNLEARSGFRSRPRATSSLRRRTGRARAWRRAASGSAWWCRTSSRAAAKSLRVFARAMHPGHALPGSGAGAAALQRVARRAAHRLSAGGGRAGHPRIRVRRKSIRRSEPPRCARRFSAARNRRCSRARSSTRACAANWARGFRWARSSRSRGPARSCAPGSKAFLPGRRKERASRPTTGRSTVHRRCSQAAGFPGERTLDTDEFQARAGFEEQLGEFARLGALPGKISAREALRQLRRICADALFQPESPDAPMQVLGVLESAGMEFDCLWVSGLTEENWPLKARPHPFLPVALQRKAGIPEAAAETSLALDRRITQGWLGAADEVVLSWPEKDGDRDLLPSPLIADVAPGSVEVVELSGYQDVLFQARSTESLPDSEAPPLREPKVRGGTRVLADQAACPFRAFARHRLQAEALDAPSAGPDAMARGTLLHALMAGIWKEVKTREGLDRDLSDVISRSAAKAVTDLGLEGRFAELERRRLERLARDWLEVEKARPAFEVVAIEEKRSLGIGGLAFSGRIDRMDRLADGTHALIDYKTGSRVTPNDWLGARPDEPQLPLYAVTAREHVSAVVYAKLRRGDMKMAGFSIREKEFPGVKQAPSWSGLVEGWKAELAALAAGFAQGSAQVDPKRGLSTCRYCDLKPLCRVHERLSALAEDGEERE